MAFPDEKDRLDKLRPAMRRIAEKCGVASVSLGVLHNGDRLFVDNLGVRTIGGANQRPPNDKTLYTICSISKSFVTAAIGILIDEGKADWKDPVGQYIPEFKPKGDARVSIEATFRDFLRHCGGLSNPVTSILGPEGKVLVPQESFIDVLNDTPTDDKDGHLFRRVWTYSNVSFGLVALIVERISGEPYAEFVRSRILEPLGMENTAVFERQVARRDLNPDNPGYPNMVIPSVQLESGQWTTIEHEWTSEHNTPILGMIGVRSSVNDLMIWAAALIDAQRPESSRCPFLSGLRNPIRQADKIFGRFWWSRPHQDECGTEALYCLGWLKFTMPCSMVNYASYNQLLGEGSEPSTRSIIQKSMLGKESPSRVGFKTTGIGYCGTSSLFLFPESKSAVVVLSNGLNSGDASDFIASLLIQELFDLRPRVDFLPIVDEECNSRFAQFEDWMEEWRKHRHADPKGEQSPEDYVGTYHGLGIDLEVRRNSSHQALELLFNGRVEIAQQLTYYNVDQYSYFPMTRDEWLRGGWLDWDYYMVGILDFKRDQNGVVNGLDWQWERDTKPSRFQKRSKGMAEQRGQPTEVQLREREPAAGFGQSWLAALSSRFFPNWHWT